MTEGIKEKAVGIGGITARAASRLAWLLWALSVALTTLSLVLLVLIRSHPGTHVFDWWLGNSTSVIDVTVGAIVASRRPENPVGWLLCLSGVAVSTSSFTSEYAIYALLAQLASGGRSDGLDPLLDAAHHEWAPGVLPDAVSHRKIAEQALEMAGVADRDLYLGGGDHLCVLPLVRTWALSAR